jgi:hypothetical protein
VVQRLTEALDNTGLVTIIGISPLFAQSILIFRFSRTSLIHVLLTLFVSIRSIVVTDNFFTSPAVALGLKERGIGLVGTVQSNRKDMPKSIGGLLSKGAARGTSIVLCKDDVQVAIWQDKKPVMFLSTVCPAGSFSPVITNFAN